PLALLVVAGEIACRTLRLRAAGAALGSELSLAGALRVTLVGDLAAAVTPANAGGEPARLWALRRARWTCPAAPLALALELGADLAVLACLLGSVGTGMLNPGALPLRTWRLLPWLLAGGAALAAVLLSRAGRPLRARLAAVGQEWAAVAPTRRGRRGA